MKFRYAAFLHIVVIFILTSPAHAEEGQLFNILTVYWENDAFIGRDGDYTNGLKLSLSTTFKTDRTGPHLPAWTYPLINLLPFMNEPEYPRAVSVSIGQDIYTPEDTDRKELIEDDRPYAGIIYVSTGFHTKKDGWKNSWEFIVGILGPHSYAEDLQNWTHDSIHSRRARGWDNQLKDELLVEAVYETQRRQYQSGSGNGFGFDVIPHLGGRIGNMNIYVNTGAEARFGWGLPGNYGTCPIRSGCETDSAYGDPETAIPAKERFGFHFFTAVDVRAVLWDITLDGNTYQDSHSVDKMNIVADLMAGAGMEYRRFKASYSYSYRTKQFRSQDRNHIFGAVSVSYAY